MNGSDDKFEIKEFVKEKLSKLQDDLIEDFVKHNRLEEAGYKRKSHFQKDKKSVEELILGTYKSRNQTYLSDIEHWCTRGFFGIKKPTIEDICKDDWNFNNEWAYWTCHSL